MVRMASCLNINGNKYNNITAIDSDKAFDLLVLINQNASTLDISIKVLIPGCFNEAGSIVSDPG